MLRAVMDVVSQHGYRGMSVALIVARARVSRTTFYEHFEDCDECFLAAYDAALSQMAEISSRAYEREGRWSERVRSGLESVLRFLEHEPAVASLVFVDALGASAKVLARRAHALERLRVVVDQGQSQARAGRVPPCLTAETLVAGAIGVVHARLVQPAPVRLLPLVNPLMAAIVLPYLGPAAAASELRRPRPKARMRPRAVNGSTAMEAGPFDGLSMRVTYRTLRVLMAIGEDPGACNREVADAAGIVDQGQISKLLSRLKSLELIHSSGEKAHAGPHEWYLTTRGEEVGQALRAEFAGRER
jgi:AcrR family transcriptional regulator